jgi:beta-glucanase (GH16 family)
VDTVVSTLHYVGGKHWVVYDANRDMTKDFHVYRMVWTPNRLVFSVDGKVTGRITENVPSHPMYPILSLGIGTNLYRADATTPSPLKMDIDYVRVYAP